jgi:hypothetical protein
LLYLKNIENQSYTNKYIFLPFNITYFIIKNAANDVKFFKACFNGYIVVLTQFLRYIFKISMFIDNLKGVINERARLF